MRCFFDRESVSAEILLPGNSGNQAKTMTSFTPFTGHYPTVCVCVLAKFKIGAWYPAIRWVRYAWYAWYGRVGTLCIGTSMTPPLIWYGTVVRFIGTVGKVGTVGKRTKRTLLSVPTVPTNRTNRINQPYQPYVPGKTHFPTVPYHIFLKSR